MINLYMKHATDFIVNFFSAFLKVAVIHNLIHQMAFD